MDEILFLFQFSYFGGYQVFCFFCQFVEQMKNSKNKTSVYSILCSEPALVFLSNRSIILHLERRCPSALMN